MRWGATSGILFAGDRQKLLRLEFGLPPKWIAAISRSVMALANSSNRDAARFLGTDDDIKPEDAQSKKLSYNGPWLPDSSMHRM